MSGISSPPPPSAASAGPASPPSGATPTAQSAAATASSDPAASSGQATSSGQAAASGSGKAPPVAASITTAPKIVSTLASGTVLPGSVLASGKSGNLLIHTQYGTLELDLKLPLQAGTRVALQIGGGGQIRLQVVGPESPPPSASRPVTPPTEAAVRLPNQILTATLQAPAGRDDTAGSPARQLAAAGGAPPAPATAQGDPSGLSRLPAVLQRLSPGAQFQLQITGIATNATRGAPPSEATGPERTPLPAVRTTGPALFQPGPRIAGSDPVVAGTVIASAAQGRPLIQTPFGVVSLNDPVQLPLGAQLRLQIVNTSLPLLPAGEPLGPAGHRPEGTLPSWSALAELAGTDGKSGIATALMGQVLQRVPSAGPALSSNMLFLFSALNAGQVGTWLGRPLVDQLQRDGYGDLVNRLEQDVILAGRSFDSNGGEWRSLVLPFLDDGQLRQLRLYLRRRREGSEGDGSDRQEADATRFLLEIELSRLGELQLDGLIRPKLFDLILRTREPLARTLREGIMRIFADANHDLGLGGQILFEASEQWQPAGAICADPDSSTELTI